MESRVTRQGCIEYELDTPSAFSGGKCRCVLSSDNVVNYCLVAYHNSGFNQSTAMFTLPEALWPKNEVYVPMLCKSSSGSSVQPARGYIGVDGKVTQDFTGACLQAVASGSYKL